MMLNESFPKIHVVLSTYNGEKYIEEQILSILNQEDVKVILVIRDDGSVDTTRNILQRYVNHSTIFLSKDFQHIGLPESYFQLMRDLQSAKFVAFADQDDIWQPRHLITLHELLIDVDGIGMASTSRMNGIYFKDSWWSRIENHVWANALVENPHPGNCVMVTGETISLFKTLESSGLYMHDSAIYALCSLIGVVKHSSAQTVDYRIHSENTIGVVRNTSVKNIKKSLKKYAIQMISLDSQLTNRVPRDISSNIHEFAKSLDCELLFHNIRYLARPIGVRLRLRDDLYLRIFVGFLPFVNRIGKWSLFDR